MCVTTWNRGPISLYKPIQKSNKNQDKVAAGRKHTLFTVYCSSFPTAPSLHLPLPLPLSFPFSITECKGKESGETVDWSSCKLAEDKGGERWIFTHTETLGVLLRCAAKLWVDSFQEFSTWMSSLCPYLYKTLLLAFISLDLLLKNFKLIIKNELETIKKILGNLYTYS